MAFCGFCRNWNFFSFFLFFFLLFFFPTRPSGDDPIDYFTWVFHVQLEFFSFFFFYGNLDLFFDLHLGFFILGRESSRGSEWWDF